MSSPDASNGTRAPPIDPPIDRSHGHDLIAVAEWLPGKVPTAYEIELNDSFEYETRFWRCRACGQERTRHDEFEEPCEVDRPPNPLVTGGYSVDDPRTRRALTEEMNVHFGERGPTYAVDSESGNTYWVDVEAETCTCPDHTKRQVFCKHLRRVDLEIRTGTTPSPAGRFNR